jgi:hypothetical protein
MVMLQFLSRAPVFLAFPAPPPLLLFALNLPCRLAAAADALLVMVNTDLLLLTGKFIALKGYSVIVPGLTCPTRSGVYKTLHAMPKGRQRGHETAGFHGSWPPRCLSWLLWHQCIRRILLSCSWAHNA